MGVGGLSSVPQGRSFRTRDDIYFVFSPEFFSELIKTCMECTKSEDVNKARRFGFDTINRNFPPTYFVVSSILYLVISSFVPFVILKCKTSIQVSLRVSERSFIV